MFYYGGYKISIDMKNQSIMFDDHNCHIVNYDFSHFDCDETDTETAVEIAVKEWIDDQREGW